MSGASDTAPRTLVGNSMLTAQLLGELVQHVQRLANHLEKINSTLQASGAPSTPFAVSAVVTPDPLTKEQVAKNAEDLKQADKRIDDLAERMARSGESLFRTRTDQGQIETSLKKVEASTSEANRRVDGLEGLVDNFDKGLIRLHDRQEKIEEDLRQLRATIQKLEDDHRLHPPPHHPRETS